ncbi:unnamed protein product [Discosporangium mesarthrocarpum]
MADSDALFAEFLGEIEATEKTIEDGQDGRSGTREGAGGALEESSKSAVGGDGGKRSGEAEGISDGPPPTAKKMRMTGKLVAAALPRKAAAPAAPRVPTPVTLAAPSSAERTGMGENTDKDVTSKSGVEGLGEGTQEVRTPQNSENLREHLVHAMTPWGKADVAGIRPYMAVTFPISIFNWMTMFCFMGAPVESMES